ncbi:MAG: hypothetical protein MUE77_08890 [Sandarakinorhabdus sp.]|jgi:hypothetical protein|nr:hypothetical protein [Sandarakinorhabdus sp.]
MFARIFEQQFQPYRDGYLVYPSRKAGGKFVTAAEHATLVDEFRQRTRPVAIAGWFALFLLLAVGASFLSRTILPETLHWLASLFVMIPVVVWSLRNTTTPFRLVRGRPDAAPPRTPAEWRAVGAAMFNWWQIGLLALVGVLQLAQHGEAGPDAAARWLGLASGVLMLLASATLAIRKWRHRAA